MQTAFLCFNTNILPDLRQESLSLKGKKAFEKRRMDEPTGPLVIDHGAWHVRYGIVSISKTKPNHECTLLRAGWR